MGLNGVAGHARQRSPVRAAVKDTVRGFDQRQASDWRLIRQADQAVRVDRASQRRSAVVEEGSDVTVTATQP